MTLPAAPLSWTDDAAAAAVALAKVGVAGWRGAVSSEDCGRWLSGTYAARKHWTADFGEEQFSLGRAFYTHLEQGKSARYFADASTSDAHVEASAPGLQAAMRALAGKVAGGAVRARHGWCGAGVHVFPAGGHAAREGGVIHFDTEGLTPHHLARDGRALSVVCMLQPAARGGGLRVWDIAYDGDDAVATEALEAPSVMALYTVGDVVIFDSYRLHQIQPFGGVTDRVSATLHLAEIEEGQWESWF